MKKGKWNYTEDILFTVVNVRLGVIPEKPLHWQNALVGEIIQAVQIIPRTGGDFFISNEDGSGLRKIEKGGGPDSYSAHLDGPFELLEDVPEEKWYKWDGFVHALLNIAFDEWAQKNHPEEFAKLQELRKNLPPHLSQFKFKSKSKK